MSEQLSIRLDAATVYVYGTVNDIEATFSLSAPNTWTAVVDKNPEGIYNIEITAYNELGASTTYTATLYSLDSLNPCKIDWNQYDTMYAADENRIEANIQFLLDELTQMGYMIHLEEIRCDWTDQAFFVVDDFNRMKRNIITLASGFYIEANVPLITISEDNIQTINYEILNIIEANIKSMDSLRECIWKLMKYAGAFYSGQEVIL